jgi:DNA modification methylase
MAEGGSMEPLHADDWLTVYVGDCKTVLANMAAASVNTIVTSPPYWGLRDYGNEAQLGLEPTPEAYVASMVDVFRLAHRVLRDDGTLWLNLGDTYAGSSMTGGVGKATQHVTQQGKRKLIDIRHTGMGKASVPAKNLLGIPWRVALALQAAGWVLRSEIIWVKPNAMPESVTDRPTKAHEHIFMLAKQAKYYYDYRSVREPLRQAPVGVKNTPQWANKRSVWSIPTAQYPGAHFAVFPADLIKPCILAGAPVGGTVLDPFGGSGTTAMVANSLGRKAVVVELNPAYAGQIITRAQQAPLGL